MYRLRKGRAQITFGHLPYALVALGCCGVMAQTPVFDAAAINPSPPADSSRGPIYYGSKGGPGTADPGRYTCTFCDISMLLLRAYDLPDYRIVSSKRLPSDRFHVVATIAEGTNKEQFLLMFQNLLADRFKLTVHRESREMQMFRLVAGPGGAKLTPHIEGVPLASQNRKNMKDHVPGVYYNVAGKTMQEFAILVEGQLGKPVIDATGLNGKFDFDLWWTFDELDSDAPATSDGPTLRSALQSVGLKLESGKRQVEVVVIDHVEKVPTEN